MSYIAAVYNNSMVNIISLYLVIAECVCADMFFNTSICSSYIILLLLCIFFSSHLDRRGRPAVAERNPMALGHRRSVFHHDHRWVHSARRAPRTTHTGALRTQTHTREVYTRTRTIRTVHDIDRGHSFFLFYHNNIDVIFFSAIRQLPSPPPSRCHSDHNNSVPI